MTPDLERILSDTYLDGLAVRAIEDVRAMRSECQSIENGLSYVRRLVQGRLDIVGSELQRRRDGGEAEELSELIGRLPDILADRSRGTGLAQPPLDMQPMHVEPLERELEQIIGAASLAATTELNEGKLAAALDLLVGFEDRVSLARQQLHEVIDLVRAEITRRYRSGEASVDSLLQA
jgi:hypothetical protein